MDFNNFNSLVKSGFKGFKSIKDLWSDPSVIPKDPGVYLVINPNFKKPQFVDQGIGGFFKGKDPNVPIDDLLKKMIPSSQVVYIGKAGSPSGSATLNSRIKQYLRFGQGKNVGHYGGRYIWQIKNSDQLIFCWKPTSIELDPREVEKILLYLFERQFKKVPFANLKG